MCGIIGYVGAKPVVPILLDALRRLEYRGYDSAGIALVDNAAIEVRRSAGKIDRLEQAIRLQPVTGDYGIGHTRWATHGRPTDENAHPHRDCTGRLVVAHNGIIENDLALKQALRSAGHRFETETDTEVIAHLVESELRDDGLERAVQRAIGRLEGLFGIVLLHADDPSKIVAARRGPPIVVGVGEQECFVASDVAALLSHTRDVVYLGDDEMAVITRGEVAFTDFAGRAVSKATQRVAWDPVMAEKDGYRHFMLKEIVEQPWALRETAIGHVADDREGVVLRELDPIGDTLRTTDQVVIVACGTSWHAALIGKFLIEQAAGIRVDVDYGSEYRYRQPVATDRTLVIAITQSGETADTLAALREAQERGARSLAICNVAGSMATRAADCTLHTHAGPEIGVASTKTFTAQILVLNLIAAHLAQLRAARPAADTRAHVEAMVRLPVLIEQALKTETLVAGIARRFHGRSDFLYLGRGINYPIALEGALKLKEISYIHAEGYPAGEMKHGPIALIDEELPVVALMPQDLVFDKMRGNLQEAKARGASVIAVTDAPPERFGDLLDEAHDAIVPLRPAHPLLMPIQMVVPLQLLAYHIAVLRGCDVDQPRNLAKSVTVE